MKYCSVSTVNHEKAIHFPSIIENVYDVFLKEGCDLELSSPFSNKNIMVINGDELENKFCFMDGRNLSSKNKSVDVIFIAKQDLIGLNLIFVELKLNSKKNFYTLNKSSFRDKTDNSQKAMGSSVPSSKKHYIVFNSRVINEAKRFLFRQNPVLDNDFVALTIVDLYRKFFI
ncbi:TPA: hypothetical protein ACGZ92_000744 [Elizabethkingia anophelis]|uniref:hypothetical protein n=1 Tax=Elizabethkingia anophelis TaxID=1117645 RepID=UPI00200DF059|nr:hypothetical protein [Elizabethkingia anophelis]MCL1035249.1 hypothetical protein [Elizabethkingia anophelis]